MNKASVDSNSPRDLAHADGHRPSRWRAFLPTTGFYLAWTGLALLSHLADRTTITIFGAALLVGAALLASLLLTAMRLSRLPDDEQVAAGQSALAIALTTAYAMVAEGALELLPGMYLTAVLIAFTRSRALRLRQLAWSAGVSYSATVLVRMLAGNSADVAWGEALQCAGVVAMLVVLSRRAQHAENRTDDLSRQVGQLEQQLRRMTRNLGQVQLTRSFNRQYILDTLLREKARADRTGHPFSICIFDLDRVRALNDTLGYPAGDRMLTAFANRARKALRSMDALSATRCRRALGRLGSEEFLVILPGAGMLEAVACADRVRDLVAQPVDEQLLISVSVGIAEYRRAESVPELLARVDRAMHAARRSGGNRVRISAARSGASKDPSPKPTLRIVR